MALTAVLELGLVPTVAELYRQDGDDIVLLSRSGSSLPFAERPVATTRIAFRLSIQAGRTETFFLKIEADDAIFARASLLSEPAFARITATRGLWQGIYLGLLLAMILYNSFIYLSTRERTYLVYVCFQSATLLLQAALDKVAFQYLWPRAPGWAQTSEQVFAAVTVLAGIHFTLAFLEVQRHAPLLARTLRMMGIAAALLAAGSMFTSASILVNVMGVFFLACLIVIAGAGVFLASKRQPNARFFLLGWIPLLSGSVLAVLAGLGLFSNEVGYVALKVGSAAEATILALALANRINVMRRDRANTDAALIAARTVQSAALEQRVTARTEELSLTLSRLKLTQERLLRQERLTSLAGMVAGMAHEVGNPLNFAQGGADVLHDRIGVLAETWRRMSDRSRDAAEKDRIVDPAVDAAQMDDVLKDVMRGVDLVRAGLLRIGKIMTNLRGHMQLRALESQPADLTAEIEATLTMVEDVLVRQGVTVAKDLAPLPLFSCSPGELNQVFMNIILNACAAMSGGGRIEITTRLDTEGYIEIAFSDTGPGILSAHREAIFEPFFSAQASGGSSTGLGLYLAREIVLRHGGQLALQDSARGARFVVRLPVSVEGDAAEVAASPIDAAPKT